MTSDADGPLTLRVGSIDAHYESGLADYVRYLSALVLGQIHGPDEPIVTVHTFGPGKHTHHGIHDGTTEGENVKELLR